MVTQTKCDNCGQVIDGEVKHVRLVSNLDYCKHCYDIVLNYATSELRKIKARVKEGFDITNKRTLPYHEHVTNSEEHLISS